MSESTIISFCYECGSKEIVKSEFGCDEFYCKNCSQVFFESVSYDLPTHRRIKELESTMLDLQSELARKKMSLTVACNRVEELEDKLKIAVEVLVKISNTPSGDSRFNTRTAAAIVLEQIGELK